MRLPARSSGCDERGYRARQRYGDGMRIGRMRPGERIERERGIADGARDQTQMDEVVERVRHLVVRDHAERRLEADEAAARGGQTRRRAGVRRERDALQPRRHRCGRAAARSTGGMCEAPRVARRAGHRRIGEQLVGELRRGGLADDHRARGLESRHGHGVRIRDVVRHGARAPHGAEARSVDDVLHRHRHAGERPDRFARGDAAIDVARRLARRVVRDGGVGVECRLGRVDAGQALLDRLGRRDLALADRLRQRYRVLERMACAPLLLLRQVLLPVRRLLQAASRHVVYGTALFRTAPTR